MNNPSFVVAQQNSDTLTLHSAGAYGNTVGGGGDALMSGLIERHPWVGGLIAILTIIMVTVVLFAPTIARVHSWWKAR